MSIPRTIRLTKMEREFLQIIMLRVNKSKVPFKPDETAVLHQVLLAALEKEATK